MFKSALENWNKKFRGEPDLWQDRREEDEEEDEDHIEEEDDEDEDEDDEDQKEKLELAKKIKNLTDSEKLNFLCLDLIDDEEGLVDNFEELIKLSKEDK